MEAQTLPPLLSFIESAQRRDEKLAQVSANSAEWMALALMQLEQIARSNDDWANTECGFLGEDVIRMIQPHIGRPRHPNVVGALIKNAIRKKIIVATGEYRAMRSPGSHGRRSAVYVWGKSS